MPQIEGMSEADPHFSVSAFVNTGYWLSASWNVPSEILISQEAPILLSKYTKNYKTFVSILFLFFIEGFDFFHFHISQRMTPRFVNLSHIQRKLPTKTSSKNATGSIHFYVEYGVRISIPGKHSK